MSIFTFVKLEYMCASVHVLVAGEISRLTGSLPFFRWWTESFITEAFRFRPNSRINYSNNDITFSYGSGHFLWKANKIPGPCCMGMFLFTGEYRHYTIKSCITNFLGYHQSIDFKKKGYVT